MLAAPKRVYEYPYRPAVATDWTRLGLIVRRARERKNISQESVARMVDWSNKQYQLLEQGRIGEAAHKPRGPSPIQLGKIADVLELPIAEMYEAAGWTHYDPSKVWGDLAAEDQALVLELVKRLVRAENKAAIAVDSAV